MEVLPQKPQAKPIAMEMKKHFNRKLPIPQKPFKEDAPNNFYFPKRIQAHNNQQESPHREITTAQTDRNPGMMDLKSMEDDYEMIHPSLAQQQSTPNPPASQELRKSNEYQEGSPRFGWYN